MGQSRPKAGASHGVAAVGLGGVGEPWLGRRAAQRVGLAEVFRRGGAFGQKRFGAVSWAKRRARLTLRAADTASPWASRGGFDAK